jgi:hypothetical protein
MRSHFLRANALGGCDDAPAMKSAYELAMERLSKSDTGSAKALTPEKRARLAEIDRVYTGKIAERDIFLRQQLERALGGSDADEVEKIRKQMALERARLEEEREAEKDAVRARP